MTRVGPGTPCGELMRRYWHPIAATVQLDDNPVRKMRILGEDLVLFRDRSGNLGLIGPRCPHRAVHWSSAFRKKWGCGVPTTAGCLTGRGAASSSRWRRRPARSRTECASTAYPGARDGRTDLGLSGAKPAPLLPRMDLFEREHELRQIVGHLLPCNWLQVMENRGDRPHAHLPARPPLPVRPRAPGTAHR